MIEPDIRLPGLHGLRWLGGGGFSNVYSAHQERFDRAVAVKILDIRRLDDATKRRFERECAAMGRLSDHPNVVTLYDAGIAPDGRPYLVSELCPGGSLADRLEGGQSFSVDDVVTIGMEIADALTAAHDAGMVHRDVKPANILFTSRGRAALADFGLSVRPDVDLSRGLDALSPVHAAPETHERGESGPKADVYSLGSTLHTLLSGAPPFPIGPGEGALQHAHRVLTEDPPAIRRADLPDFLRDLLSRMLSKEPDERPTAAESAAVLKSGGPVPLPPPAAQDLRYGERTGLRPTASSSSAVGASTTVGGGDPTTLRPGSSPATGHESRGSRTLVWVAVAAVLLIGGGVVWVLGNRAPGQGTPGAQPSPVNSPATASAGSGGDAPVIALEDPVDGGTTVSLRWEGPAGWQFAVIAAAQTGDRTTQLAGEVTSYDMAVDADTPYCFLVQGTDGAAVVESAPVGIRGAVCDT